jgi:predicted NBD/HSP70 family sugar kinase
LTITPAIRLQNLREVLDVVVGAGPDRSISRDAIIEATGLARATVIRGLNQLREWNDLMEPSPLEFTAEQGQTRRAEHVRLADDGDYVVGAEFSHRQITVARADVWGRILSRHDWQTTPASVDPEPHASVDVAAKLARKVVGDRELDRLVGVGVAIAAPVDPVDQIVMALKGEPERGQVTWIDLNPARELAKRLYDWPAPFFVDNDANVAALEEFQWLTTEWDRQRSLKDFVHLKWSSGLGSALILDAELHTGAFGLSGEIGHTPVFDVDKTPTTACERCGRFNCLENICSYSAMRRAAGLEDLTRREFDENKRGREHISEAAVHIGRALGQLANAINPQAIAISGPSPELHSLIVQQVRLGLSDTAVAAARNVEIYVAEPRWRDAGDDIGRLAVVSGAIHSVVRARAGAHLLARLSGLEIPDSIIAHAS